MSLRDVYRAMRNPITPRVVERRDLQEMQDYISEYVFSLLNAPKQPYTVTCAATIEVLRTEGTVVLDQP